MGRFASEDSGGDDRPRFPLCICALSSNSQRRTRGCLAIQPAPGRCGAARDRSTILRAIRHGKLSATRGAATGGWLIEPAELHRLYPAQPDAQQRNADAIAATAVLEARLEGEQAKVAMLERVNDDLRRLLDEERRERRQVQARLDALLTDQRSALPAPVRRSWWRWRRG
jgi:hypothetical protein